MEIQFGVRWFVAGGREKLRGKTKLRDVAPRGFRVGRVQRQGAGEALRVAGVTVQAQDECGWGREMNFLKRVGQRAQTVLHRTGGSRFGRVQERPVADG